jgi:hypothetical protein
MADMGDRPTERHSIDRIDNRWHYSCGRCEECRQRGWPANCRWATSLEQSRNRAYTVRLTLAGRTQTAGEWAEELKMPAATLVKRVREWGWSEEKSLTTPWKPRDRGVTRESERWRSIRTGMIARCTRPTCNSYPLYGGRGITVCARWMTSPKAFRDDMWPRPTPAHSIDRIDNDKGYWCGKAECPECGSLDRSPNCRWATAAEQNWNRRPKH